MEPAIQVLTSLRLADIQCTTYGHPVSSGFKHIDYFFSSELMEKNDSQKNYSEKLIKLPNIAIDFDLPNLSTTQTSKNIKKTNKIIFLNLQSLFKLLPSHDHIYFDIIKKINNCQFWFVEDLKKSITTLFKNRIAKFCRYYDLSFDKYFLFHQKMKQPDFFNLIKQSDVILDSLEWSGGKTSLDAIALHKPMVTLPGKLMRGRHTYGILKLLNLEQTIASSKKEYVKIAIKLATDKNFRNMISNKIKINKNRLYNDETPIRFLEQFFKNEFKI
jgi:predicted O-linked N-acetylglucosamine transferase (SPINDLY family)